MFYIGKTDKGKKFEIDPNTLTKHALVIGATGSGKTVLCKNIIEQAIMNNIPALIIDPKGDIGTISIASTNNDFRPFSDTEANSKDISPEKYAKVLSKEYIKEHKNWKISKDLIKTYIDKLDLKIFTPKSNFGLELGIAPRLDPPLKFKEKYENNPHIVTEIVEPIALSLLQLVGYEKNYKREYAFLTQIILYEWLNQKSITLVELISLIQNPPFEKIGALKINEFLTKSPHSELISNMNLLLSMPSLNYWFRGEKIDVQDFFLNKKGKTKVNVIDLRWITNENERHFLIDMLLQEIYKWLLKQSGTEKLRGIFYFDELKGFLPPYPYNPASKRLLEVLIRQGRAYGLSCIYATQNPGDIDYKVLSNINTRFIGNLKTSRDISKVSLGMEINKNELERKISKLKVGEFLYNDALTDKFEKIKSKWLISYHRGPLTGKEINYIVKGKKKLDSMEISSPIKLQSKIIEKNLYVLPELKSENIIKYLSKFKIKPRIIKNIIQLKPWKSILASLSVNRDEDNFKLSESFKVQFCDLTNPKIEFIQNVFKDAKFEKEIPKKIIKLKSKHSHSKVLDNFQNKIVKENTRNYTFSNLTNDYYNNKDSAKAELEIKFDEDIKKSKENVEEEFSPKIKSCEDDLEEVKLKKSHLNQEIRTAQNEVRHLRSDRIYSRGTLTIDRNIRSKSSKIERLEHQIEQIDLKIDKLEKNLNDLNDKKEEEVNKIEDDFEKQVENSLSDYKFVPNEREIVISEVDNIWEPIGKLEVEIKGQKEKSKVEVITTYLDIVSIGACREDKKSIDNLNDVSVCYIDGDIFCKKHTSKCKFCKGYICKKHRWKCGGCKEYCCENEKKYKCSDCSLKVCKSCLKTCVVCNKRFFNDHLYKCYKCSKFVCEKDKEECHICKKASCKDHIKKCLGCKKQTCKKEFIKCKNCGERVCSKCKVIKRKFLMFKTERCVFCAD